MSSPETRQFRAEVPNEKMRRFLNVPRTLGFFLPRHKMAYEDVYTSLTLVERRSVLAQRPVSLFPLEAAIH